MIKKLDRKAQDTISAPDKPQEFSQLDLGAQRSLTPCPGLSNSEDCWESPFDAMPPFFGPHATKSPDWKSIDNDTEIGIPPISWTADIIGPCDSGYGSSISLETFEPKFSTHVTGSSSMDELESRSVVPSDPRIRRVDQDFDILSDNSNTLHPKITSEVGHIWTEVRTNPRSCPDEYAKKESRSSSPTNQKSTPLSIPEDDHGTTIRTRTESDSSDDTASPSPENDAWLTVAYVKHRMIISLMRDVYAIFDPHWKAEVSSHAGNRAASTGARAQHSNSRTPPSAGKSKRRMQHRDSPPPDGNDEKKRKTKSSSSGDDGQRLFACCFHKFNAQRYCSNDDTGSRYRSCAGPGFSKISKLKQHLKRTHRAPPHCLRCWLVLESHADMSLHLNTEERCRRQEPQVIEGVDEEKMRLITETWGISWEGIYEILFPGAPVPSPYYEPQNSAPDFLEPSSPGSRELRDFEVYNRATLPLLVEANLRAIVETQVAPIEERVRAMVVDIVRTCQSTVARSFQLTIAPTLSVHDRTPPSFQASFSNENAAHTHEEPVHGSAYGSAGNSLNFFQEASPINAEASASLPTPMYVYDNDNSINRQTQSQDSGYGTLTEPCDCTCHSVSDTRNTINGQSNCLDCTLNHVNLNDFDFPLPNAC